MIYGVTCPSDNIFVGQNVSDSINYSAPPAPRGAEAELRRGTEGCARLGLTRNQRAMLDSLCSLYLETTRPALALAVARQGWGPQPGPPAGLLDEPHF